MAPLPDPGIDK